MLNIADYFSEKPEGVAFTEAQASRFAKAVAGDFNPIHDIGAKRFCVPGDLLFAVLLNRYGIYQQLHVDLLSLVGADKLVKLPDSLKVLPAGELGKPVDDESAAINVIADADDKAILSIGVGGRHTDDSVFVTALVEQYVQFSGKTFPDILVALMRKEGVMINPSRPLVIYKDMSLQLNEFELTDSSSADLTLTLADASMSVDGKKGAAKLQFDILAGGEKIGQGVKNMVLGGFREYDESAMADIVDQYNAWKREYQEHSV